MSRRTETRPLREVRGTSLDTGNARLLLHLECGHTVAVDWNSRRLRVRCTECATDAHPS